MCWFLLSTDWWKPSCRLNSSWSPWRQHCSGKSCVLSLVFSLMKTDRATFIFDRIMFQGKDKLAFFFFLIGKCTISMFLPGESTLCDLLMIFGLTVSASTHASIISPPSNLHFLIFTNLENEKVLVWCFFTRKRSWISVLDKLSRACKDGGNLGHFSWCPAICWKKKNCFVWRAV